MHFLLTTTKEEREQAEILQEIEALCSIHDKIIQSSECREFNRRTAILLQRLEDAGCYQLENMTFDLLATHNPKDLFSEDLFVIMGRL